jgi:ribosomal protein S18 acetylase RimI-like enzyme
VDIRTEARGGTPENQRHHGGLGEGEGGRPMERNHSAAVNAAAIRAYEKVGFRTVGVMREYWRSPDGSWRDGLLMDLLAYKSDRV